MSEVKETTVKENKMGTMSINKLLVTMALPIVFSMLIEAIYNVMDTFWLARVDEMALASMAIAGPVLNVMIALGVGTGVGVNSLLSKSLGAKNYRLANDSAKNGIFISVIYIIVFILFGLFGTRIYMNLQTNNEQIIDYGVTYLTVNTAFSAGLFAQLIYEKLLQATGNTKYLVLTQGLGAVINLILDPILIFGHFGFPAMGVLGAAVSNVIGQTVGGIVAIVITHKKTKEININLKGFKPSTGVIGEIFKVGLPSIIMMTIGSVMTFTLNRVLEGFTSTATAFVGIYFKIQSFIFMPVFGVTNALVPIMAYNYGAQNKERMKKAAKLGLLYVSIIMLFGMLLFQIFPRQVLVLFKPSPELMAIGMIGLRIVSSGYLVAGYCIACSSMFQALGNGVYSMLVSIIRQLVVLIPVTILLSLTGNVNNVWWSFPISEVFALVFTTVYLVKTYKTKVKILPDIPPDIIPEIEPIDEDIIF